MPMMAEGINAETCNTSIPIEYSLCWIKHDIIF